MDTDRQIPLKFLDEAEDCCDRIESTVLGLAETIADPQTLDEALRAAHSIKGGAAMMGFIVLSQVSHQLEDFFKILRVRYHTKAIDIAVETLLLQGIDLLRHAIDLHRQPQPIDETHFTNESQPIFDLLRQQLGELRPEDEDALLSQEGDINPAMLMFESGVKAALDFLASRLDTCSPNQVLPALAATAEELSDFGRMAKLDRFIDLCASVKSQCQHTEIERAKPLAHQAMKIWRKSHAVVLLGRFDKIPDRLPRSIVSSVVQPIVPASDFPTNDGFNPALTGMEGIVDLAAIDLTLLQSEIGDLDSRSERLRQNEPESLTECDRISVPVELLGELAAFDLADSTPAFANTWDAAPDIFADDLATPELLDELAVLDLFDPTTTFAPNWTDRPSLELLSELANFDLQPQTDLDSQLPDRSTTELLDELAVLELPVATTAFAPNWTEREERPDFDSQLSDLPSLELLDELAAVDLPELSPIAPPVAAAISPAIDPVSTVTPPQPKTAASRQTVRVPVEYLQQLNQVFGSLVLERNAINLRLHEIQNYTGLLRTRMQLLESSNQELRQWYDRASTEAAIPNAEQPRSSLSNPNLASSPTEFDLLEMDRYSDLHLVSQGQIETIVQLQEVAGDIELSLREMTQSVNSLNQTTRTIQSNLTRTQMLPFADVVKRFPRLIRDLSVQFGKSVTLKIVGEHTGIDRSMLEHLNDPLIHLLRNAFDHGIEDPATRLAAGKSAQGTIVLEASQRVGETVITIADDGGGIRLDRICQRLEQLGLPSLAVAQMSETELLDTIFEPGFSTATSLTELSGRGVGMDVVRTNIDRIRGTIRVKTLPGVGTTFTIRVPFTLSIVRVMLLERAGFVFAVALDSIRETLAFQPNLLTADGRQIAWQSQLIPLIAIEQGLSFGHNHQQIALSGTPTIAKPTILVVGEDNRSIAFSIDRYWGEREVTRRSIDSLMPLTPGFGNSIILGDGRVVPLVDLMQLADWMTATANSLANLNLAPVEMPMAIDRHQLDTILVIDDSINVRRYLAVMLEKAGYRVEQAKDGQEAVEKLLGGLVVQAVLCDVEMPRLDGYGVLEALRADETFAELPIVMLTSRSSDKHRQLAMNLGASAYFSKPYTEPELLAALSSEIDLSRGKHNSLAISAPA